MPTLTQPTQTPLDYRYGRFMPKIDTLQKDKTLRKAWCNYLKKFAPDEFQGLIENRLYNLRQNRASIKPRPFQKASYLQRLQECDLRPNSEISYRLGRKTKLVKVFRYEKAIGIEIECFSKTPIDRKLLPYWVRESGDGSINPRDSNARAIEYRILMPRSELESRLHSFCKQLNSNGYAVNASCGLHVHFDFRGQNLAMIKRHARKLDSWLYTLRELVPQSRRVNEQYCDWGISQQSRYKAVNICAFSEHGTIEVRLHSGTTNFTKIVNWIRLVEAIFQQPKPPKNSEHCIKALNELPLTDLELFYWLNRHRALNPGLYSQEIAVEQE